MEKNTHSNNVSISTSHVVSRYMYYIYINMYCYFITAVRHIIVVVDGLIIYKTVVGTDIDDLYSKKNEPNPGRTTMHFLQRYINIVYIYRQLSPQIRQRIPHKSRLEQF